MFASGNLRKAITVNTITEKIPRHYKTRFNLRGKHVTWILRSDWGWVRIMRVIVRWGPWPDGEPRIQYIRKANVTARKENQVNRYHPKGKEPLQGLGTNMDGVCGNGSGDIFTK